MQMGRERERERVLLNGQWLTQMDRCPRVSKVSALRGGLSLPTSLEVSGRRGCIQQASPSLAASFAMLSPGPTVCDSKQTNLDGTVSWAGGQGSCNKGIPQAELAASRDISLHLAKSHLISSNIAS